MYALLGEVPTVGYDAANYMLILAAPRRKFVPGIGKSQSDGCQ